MLKGTQIVRHLIFLSIIIFLFLGRLSAAEEARKGCNDADLAGEFALKNGPQFVLPDQQKSIADRVIAKLKKGYGGTLVTAPGPDKTLDSSAFLSKYLREFSSPEKDGIISYDYRISTILRRASEYPVMLDDPRLDWDIWRSVLVYVNSSDGKDEYTTKGPDGDPAENPVRGAKDLAWMYIEHQADRLMKNKDRQKWWIDHLIDGLNKRGSRQVNRWFLFQFCILADPSRRQLLQPIECPEDNSKPLKRKPSAIDPFLVVEKETKSPVFKDALHMIVDPLGLSFEVWGINPNKMPSARVLKIALEMVKWPTDDSYVIGQESWSTNLEMFLGGYYSEWGVNVGRFVGQRGNYGHISFPEDRKDGVFFFAFNKRLYVWPKAEMDAGLLQMLRVEGLIDDAMWTQLVEARGFHKLNTTLTFGL
jgi:hypothetical protein